MDVKKLIILYINIRMQTGFELNKQTEIEFWLKTFGVDIIHMQECHIT